jgi:xanthine dehydrogenase YagS FAD-binding subunit
MTMRPFTYAAPRTVAEAIDAYAAAGPDARFLAGGTTLYDLMRLEVETPPAVVDIHRIAELDTIDTVGPNELVFGAGARMSDVAEDPVVRTQYPALSESLWRAASPQLRNMATLGGNLLQRTRCGYFRGGPTYSCNKREPGSGCDAVEGINTSHAVLGISDSCIATYPGDAAAALLAFDAVIDVAGPRGERTMPLADLHVEPGDTPEREHTLDAGELIVRVRVPRTPVGRGSTYHKIRPRESYAFAFAAAAAALTLTSNGIVDDCRIALGGVATRPWRAEAAERSLIGGQLSPEATRRAGEIAFTGARPGKYNAFKVELGIRTVADALRIAGERVER